MIVALYARVSTEEQAEKGYSIETQINTLKEYAERNNYTIFKEYKDEGISGSKINRPALNELLSDIEKNKIDLVLFTNLDRWFRSVKQYYKIQDILDKHNVKWNCVLEDYETSTAEGIFKVNIMLSVSQQYRDITSAKVKHAMNSRIQQGYYVSTPPYGYRLEKKDKGNVLVKDEKTKHIVEEYYSVFERTLSLRKANMYVYNAYGVNFTNTTSKGFLTKEIYTGTYKGVENYCEPYISSEKQKKYWEARKKNDKDIERHTYIFKGLVKCPCCGKSMCGNTVTNKPNKPKYYRCNNYLKNKSCSNKHQIKEADIETYLVENVKEQLRDSIYKVESKNNETNLAKNKKYNESIKSQQKRLNDLYVIGRIDEKEYNAKYEALEHSLLPIDIVDTKQLKQVLKLDFEGLYKLLDDEKKQVFWGNLIESIEIDGNNFIVHFRFV